MKWICKFLQSKVHSKNIFFNFKIWWTGKTIKGESFSASTITTPISLHFLFFSPNTYVLPNNYICINKLLHVCNIFIVLRSVRGTPATFKTKLLRHKSTGNQIIASVTKKIYSNVKGVLDQSLVTRYSRKRNGRRSGRV